MAGSQNWHNLIGVSFVWLGFGISYLVNAYVNHNGLAVLVAEGIICLVLFVLTVIATFVMRKREKAGESYPSFWIVVVVLYYIMGAAALVPGYTLTYVETPVGALTIPGFILIGMATAWLIIAIMIVLCCGSKSD